MASHLISMASNYDLRNVALTVATARSVADRLQLSTPPVPGLGAAAAAAALGGGHTPQVVIPPAQLGGLPQLVSPLAAFGGMDPLNSFFLMPQATSDSDGGQKPGVGSWRGLGAPRSCFVELGQEKLRDSRDPI